MLAGWSGCRGCHCCTPSLVHQRRRLGPLQRACCRLHVAVPFPVLARRRSGIQPANIASSTAKPERARMRPLPIPLRLPGRDWLGRWLRRAGPVPKQVALKTQAQAGMWLELWGLPELPGLLQFLLRWGAPHALTPAQPRSPSCSPAACCVCCFLPFESPAAATPPRPDQPQQHHSSSFRLCAVAFAPRRQPAPGQHCAAPAGRARTRRQ